MRSWLTFYTTCACLLFALLPVSSSDRTPRSSTVLVLGSGGLVGRELTKHLRGAGYSVLEVAGRLHFDLRKEGSLDSFNNVEIDFAFFLACEVGGSKYLGTAAAQSAVTIFNKQIYSNVFPYLTRRKIKFLFASSMLATEATPYGRIKADGEVLTRQSGFGKSFRLYNVYGFEHIGAKSHVLADWMYNCLKEGIVNSSTDGLEERQFSHSKDVAVALVRLMEHFAEIPDKTYVTTGLWTSLRDVSALISQAIENECTFHFTSVKSSLARGQEPTNLWLVNSSLPAGMVSLRRFYSSLLTQENGERHSRPYVSFVVPAHSDQALVLRFVNGITELSVESSLAVEVLIVDCAPNFNREYFKNLEVANDLPLSQRFPWPAEHVPIELRILSVNKSVGCSWQQVGMQKAMGEYVLLSEMTTSFPASFFGQLQLRRLPKWPLRIRVVYGTNVSCELAHQLGACLASIESSCSYSSFERDTLKQEAHVEGLGTDMVLQRRRAVMPTHRSSYFDSNVCSPEPGAPAQTAFTKHDSGVSSQVSLLKDFVNAAFNPEEPLKLFEHHQLFRLFRPYWKGPFDPSFVVDFLGTRTAYEYDCGNIERYRMWHLSRRIPCARQDLFKNLAIGSVVGDLPIVDEEYFEWLPLLRAASAAAELKISRPFAVVELGARYGTWAVRGGMVWRRLAELRPVQLLAVEADATCFRWLQSHLQHNGFNSTAALRGFVSDTDGTQSFSAWRSSPSTELVPSFSIQHVLQNFSVVDIIHCDIQGSESAFLTKNVMDLLRKKVKSIHFGTHGTDLHSNLYNAFQTAGWTVVENMQFGGGTLPGRSEQTEFGAIRILWDGMLTVENPDLKAA